MAGEAVPRAAGADVLYIMPPLKAARCDRHVCEFRYADDMRRPAGPTRLARRRASGLVRSSRRRRGGDSHRDAEPAGGSVGKGEGAVVCLGDALDDCQAASSPGSGRTAAPRQRRDNPRTAFKCTHQKATKSRKKAGT